MTSVRRVMPERDLFEPLIQWLRRTRLANPGAIIAHEVFLHGKRIDVVLIGRTNVVSCFELKTNHSAGVLNQATLNTLSCDRSYIVTAAYPLARNLQQAAVHGVGWLVVRDGAVITVLRARRQRPVSEARSRLRIKARQEGVRVGDV